MRNGFRVIDGDGHMQEPLDIWDTYVEKAYYDRRPLAIDHVGKVLFAYAPRQASVMTPSAGYTFVWSGYLGGNAEGIRIKRFRMEPIASDRIEAEQTYDMKVVCADMGLFVSNAVADPS